MTVGDQIKQLANRDIKDERIYSEVCTVVSVNETTRLAVCQPIDDSAQLKKVRLQAIKSQTLGMFLKPKVDSYVIVSFIDKVNGFITQTTELDKILIDTDLVQFNGGSNGELINIDSQTTKLNDLVTKVNDLYTLLQTWTVLPQDGGLALQTAALLLSGASNFDKDDYKDTKITH